MLGSDIMAWAVSGIPEDTTAIDGLPTTPARAVAARGGAPHPNGAIGIDHVVIMTPDFDRTAAALEQHAMPLRRIRDAGGFRQGFRRLGPAILELVEALDGPPGPARFWGLVVIVERSGRPRGASRRPPRADQAGRPAGPADRHAALLRRAVRGRRVHATAG